ncbi:hypothetical protein HYPSUDRAFT_39442 [Hypholoma sublateritium FD-334 SS-4]|uniref:Cytochrome P450 n=1 Tax=Hypholoma sublateritium (strain FD-334 SS-4) TaxID=945553 RepID=A0A0D2L9L2_HYPSF|nr:hypothetical protein HYPSUDRAFT_39442 [Hypholoma sublateritium FD-334 SS-4]
MPSALIFLDVGLLAVGVILIKKILSTHTAPLPPGPRKLPFLGNLLDMPSSQEWLTFADWGRKWGDMVSISIFGQTIVVLNSVDVAVDMLEKKSVIYSDRPVLQMGGELVGWKKTLVLVPYGDRFRNYRKLFHKSIGSNAAISKFSLSGEMETHKLLKRILANPDELGTHVRKTVGSVILRISHGYKVKDGEDPFVRMADIATEQFGLSTAPGGFLVNLVPALKYIPTWFPGAGFQKTAAEWSKTLVQMAEGPHQFVKQQMADGTAEPSFTSRLLGEPGLTDEQEFDIKWSAASLYSGGADTSVASIYALFLAMALNPEVMAKAQKEIDVVIGNERLPGYADRENLPYINALVKEVFRWHSVAPTGVPHRVMQDDIHNGYLIPKGTIILPNIWGMTHDPKAYADPFAFKPERFLGPNAERDPSSIYFGFGRRICPGRLLADASVFISTAMTLAVFNITPPKGNDIEDKPVHEQLNGTISHPKPFRCSITPRSAKAEELINQSDV